MAQIAWAIAALMAMINKGESGRFVINNVSFTNVKDLLGIIINAVRRSEPLKNYNSAYDDEAIKQLKKIVVAKNGKTATYNGELFENVIHAEFAAITQAMSRVNKQREKEAAAACRRAEEIAEKRAKERKAEAKMRDDMTPLNVELIAEEHIATALQGLANPWHDNADRLTFRKNLERITGVSDVGWIKWSGEDTIVIYQPLNASKTLRNKVVYRYGF